MYLAILLCVVIGKKKIYQHKLRIVGMDHGEGYEVEEYFCVPSNAGHEDKVLVPFREGFGWDTELTRLATTCGTQTLVPSIIT